ncbi:MAG: sugar phosphate isomerase/epimerase [Clostridiales bacterium]|nr:sugar phosphate isomerase/epimerase [Clostridiales bacterium]
MKDSIHKYFQVGTIQWMSYPGTPPMDSLRAICRDDYFDAIEIKGYGEEDPKALELLEQSHMTVCFGAQPWLLGPKLNPNAIDEAEREKAEDALLQALDRAEYFHAKGMAFLAGKWNPETRDQAYDQLLKTTGNVCRRAAEKGIRVELEVFDYDMDKAALIGPAPYAARFAADVRMSHSNFGLLVDLSHFPTTYETSRFVVRTLRPYITHFHFGNAVVKKGCDAYGDLHPRLGYPNSANDTAELLDYLRVLKQEGFLDSENPCVLSMEVSPRPGEDEGIVLANTKRVLNRAWALLED